MPKYPGVQKKGRLWYWYINYQHKRYWSRGFATAEDATRDRIKEQGRINAGIRVDDRITFGDFSKIYLRDHIKGRLRRGTYELRESCLRLYILPLLGSLRLRDIRSYHIERLQNELLKTQSVNNVRKVMNTLRNVFRRAEIWEFIGTNPALKVDMPKPERTEKKILTPEQFIILLENTTDLRDRLIISLAAMAGLRKGEIFGLMWKDVNLRTGTLNLERQWSQYRISPLKTDKSKSTLPLLEEAVLLLKEWKLKCGSMRWVFPAKGERQPIDSNYWYRARYKPLLKSAGLPDVTLHSLRHSFASIAIASGVSVADLQALMRHSNYRITMDTYTHTLPGQLESALAKYRSFLDAERRKMCRKRDS